MRILQVAPKIFHREVQPYLYESFRRLGHEVLIFDYRQDKTVFLQYLPIIGHRHVIAVFRPLVPVLDLRLVRVAEEFRPDFILVDKGESIWAGTILELKRRLKVPVALLFVDDPQFHFMARRYYKAYDHYFTSSFLIERRVREAGFASVHYIPYSFNDKVHRRVELTEEERRRYGCDANFVGTFYPERLPYLRAIRDFDLRIWGRGWRLPLALAGMSGTYRGAHIPSEEWVKVMNASITVNIHMRAMREGGMKSNGRTYEATACGSLLLTDRALGIEDLFEPGKEIVVYDSPKDLREKLAYYLAHRDEAAAIAEAGYRRCHRDHTMDERARFILRTVGLM